MAFYNYGDIAASTADNGPGVCEVYIAPLSYFDTIQKPTASASAGQSVTISQTHTFNANKGFIKALGAIKVKQEIKSSTYGDTGSQSMKYEITVPVAGLNAALLEFVEGGLNEPFILLGKDNCCGVGSPIYLQYGCEDKPAKMMAESNTGTVEGGGFKGFTLKFESYGVPKVYTGTVTLYS